MDQRKNKENVPSRTGKKEPSSLAYLFLFGMLSWHNWDAWPTYLVDPPTIVAALCCVTKRWSTSEAEGPFILIVHQNPQQKKTQISCGTTFRKRFDLPGENTYWWWQQLHLNYSDTYSINTETTF